MVEITEDVNAHIADIASHINNEAQMVTRVSSNMKQMESFATNTQATSEECVAMSNELYEQVNLMNSKVAEFKLE